MRIRILFLIFSVLFLLSFDNNEQNNNHSNWSNTERWYQPDSKYDTAKIDIIYFVSTNVVSAYDENGKECWLSMLTDDDKRMMETEISWVNKNMFYDDFNVISPYYHQFTFNSISQLKEEEFNRIFANVSSEAYESFEYYMKNINHGRRFILAGFSQGAMLTLNILKRMTDEQYSRMIACYTIGYRLTAEDLRHPHVKAATGETDKGVVVSFNSAMTKNAIWPMVSHGAATCINPINWKTDSTPASFTFEGTTNTVHVDRKNNILIVKTSNRTPFYKFYKDTPIFKQAGVSRKNLHHWDILFYSQQIHDNALKRARNE